MSVLVPTYSTHSYLTRRHFNGRMMFSKDEDNDRVPSGVVNSMKQRLLEQVKHKNDNLISNKSKFSPLKSTKCLSRSQENILERNSATSYLKPKENLIIIDKTLVHEHRHSYSEFHVDEVPKPGTVSTVKNMFERQIHLSRRDDDRHSTSRSSRRHSTRTRSVSPNDMAFRQRRTVALPSYPDLVISHRPFQEKISSDIVDEQPFDFRSRIARFNRINTNQQAMKSTTFFAGLKINDNAIAIIEQLLEEKIDIPDVIGGNIKLIKSSIASSGKQKQKRVQFIEDVQTYEYPSLNFVLSEYSSSDSDEDKINDEIDDDELDELVKINSNENILQSKGSLHTFRPTHLDQYELGSQHGLLMSDSSSRDKSENDTTNHVHWSSMSTTTDLLF